MRLSRPTGSAPTNLPFWDELDDARFEEYCAAFLNYNPIFLCERGGKVARVRILSALGQLTGQEQHGDVLASADNGEKWLFECKHVKGFGRNDVRKAIRKAESGSPMKDQYVLVVTCKLSTAAQKEIHDRPKWTCWDAARLTTETAKLKPQDGRALVKRFFREDWAKRLFPWGDQPLQTWQDFFERDLSHHRACFHHRTEYVACGDTLERLETFARRGGGGALVLSAAGGQGKSRLLLELAKRLAGSSEPIRVRFLNLGRSGLADDQVDLLGREEEDLLLIVDDGHRLDAALADVSRAVAKNRRIRLLVATRPHASAAVSRLLFTNGYEEHLEELLLRGWRAEEIHRLSQQVLGPGRGREAAHLAGLADKCPLLVVIGAGLIKAGSLPDAMTDHETFRQRVFRGFKGDFLLGQPEPDRKRMDRLIRFLSLVSPAPRNEPLLSKAAEVIGCLPMEAAEDLEALKAAGLVVENREGARLYPDLFADAVLLDACLDSSGKASHFIQTALGGLSFADFPALMRNLAQADWEARSKKGAKDSLFDPIWKEFVLRFEQSGWRAPNENLSRLVQSSFNENPAPRPADRDDLLSAWAVFAIYLPERTLELAEMAIRSVEVSGNVATPASEDKPAIRPNLSALLTPLLLPLVTWHPKHAEQALDMLWSLRADKPVGHQPAASNPIAAIADAGRFAADKPPSSSESVIGWLEVKLRGSEGIDRVRLQPWLLSALLKPFFARLIESRWATESALTFSVAVLPVEKTRPVRGRALALAERFLCSSEEALASAAVPVFGEAIRGIESRFRFDPTADHCALWRADRLEALSVLERGIAAQCRSPLLLFQIRRLLLAVIEYDPDTPIVEKCKALLPAIPDSFELRVARALASFSLHEIPVKPGPDLTARLEDAQKRWADFCREVAREAASHCADATAFCSFLAGWVKDLAGCGDPAQAQVLIKAVSALSKTWSATLLDELVASSDPRLDRFLWAALPGAKSDAHEHYVRALADLGTHGRPEQVCSLVVFLQGQAMQSSGLNQVERDTMLALSRRTEEDLVCAIATASGVAFSREPSWALELLRRLKPTRKEGQSAVFEALARLAEDHASELDVALVAECLGNLETYLAKAIGEHRELQVLAEKFPKQVYECLGHLLDEVEGVGEALAVAEPFNGSIPFGHIEDKSYVPREIERQWSKAVGGGRGARGRLFLAGSLIWSTPDAAPGILARFIRQAATPNELKLAAKLAAPQGSDFVFRFPDLVRELLTRSKDLGVGDDVHRTLWLAASGGARSYTEGRLDPESRYISERAEDFAKRYGEDPVLATFYRGVAGSEHRSQAALQRAWEETEEAL
jgi:hypothetical protein